MNKITKRFALAASVAMVCAIAATLAHAQTGSQTDASVANSEIGHAAKGWLELQRTNASPAQPMLGDEAGLAYRRYMESFKSRIPDAYGSPVKQGSGGGSGLSPSN